MTNSTHLYLFSYLFPVNYCKYLRVAFNLCIIQYYITVKQYAVLTLNTTERRHGEDLLASGDIIQTPSHAILWSLEMPIMTSLKRSTTGEFWRLFVHIISA